MAEDNDNNDVVVQQETEAKTFGWVPKEEFKGEEAEWRDADTFLRRGKEINGFLRKDLEKIQRTLQSKDAEIAEIRSTMEDFRKYHNETEQRAYKRAIEDLKQEKSAAIAQGDGDKVVLLDEQLDTLKEAQRTPTAPAAQPVPDPKFAGEFQTWQEENNSWWMKDMELTELAVDFGEILKKKNPNMLGKVFLDEVLKKVKSVHPDKFENPNRQNSAVGSSSQGGGSLGKKKKSYDNLPPEAKKACDKFTKQKLMTQEQYIADYEWD